MKLIFLYGPPAVGKLTVAKQLAKITGYPLFHNHLSIDLADTFLVFGTKAHARFVRKLREDVFALASKENIPGLIFTYVYASGSDDIRVGRYIKIVRKHRGEVLFVQLTASERALHRRLKHASRMRYNKIKTSKKLQQVLQRYETTAAVPHKPNLVINTEKMKPLKAAQKIQQYYKLPNVVK